MRLYMEDSSERMHIMQLADYDDRQWRIIAPREPYKKVRNKILPVVEDVLGNYDYVFGKERSNKLVHLRFCNTRAFTTWFDSPFLKECIKSGMTEGFTPCVRLKNLHRFNTKNHLNTAFHELLHMTVYNVYGGEDPVDYMVEECLANYVGGAGSGYYEKDVEPVKIECAGKVLAGIEKKIGVTPKNVIEQVFSFIDGHRAKKKQVTWDMYSDYLNRRIDSAWNLEFFALMDKAVEERSCVETTGLIQSHYKHEASRSLPVYERIKYLVEMKNALRSRMQDIM